MGRAELDPLVGGAVASSIAFAVGSPSSSPAPEPEPPTPVPPVPPAPCYTADELEAIARHAAQLAVGIAADRAVAAWVRYLEAPRPAAADAWGVGTWDDGELYGAD